jgi:cell wall-associated NlpC family hydrolase
MKRHLVQAACLFVAVFFIAAVSTWSASRPSDPRPADPRPVIIHAELMQYQAPSSPRAWTKPGRLKAYDWAVHHTHGLPYIWGGTGPYGYDCSGLARAAWEHAGIVLPRTTYEMLDSWHLRRTYHPRKGDLAFYGSGHVELYAGGHVTYGAHESGQAIGWIHFGWGWVPTMYFRVIR